jgi:hypothetical protein
LVNGVGIYDHVLPDLLQQPGDAYDLTGVLREAEEEAHAARLKLGDDSIPRDFVDRRIYPIVPDTQERWAICL